MRSRERMRVVAALAAAVLAVGLFFWLRPSTSGPVPDVEPEESVGTGTAPPSAGRTQAGLDRVSSTAPKRMPRNLPREPATATYDTGSAAIRLVPESGVTAAPTVRITIEALGPENPAQPVFAARADGLFAASRIPAGKHRIRVFSEGALEAVAEIEVQKDAETVVDVPLAPGATAAYEVTMLSGDPQDVTLELLDARGNAIPAVYQTPVTTVRIAPEKPRVVPPTGKVLGLRPGKYVLKAKSAAGETAEQAFTATTGETTPVELRLRR
jgi:hypothetical protein